MTIKMKKMSKELERNLENWALRGKFHTKQIKIL